MKNACVVGYGAIGPIHAQAIEKANNVTLYGICDIDKSRADQGAKEHFCKAFYDFSKVLSDPSVTSVHICTPHFLHHSMAIEAARAGKEVILEKPAAINLEKFHELENELRGNKVCVMLQNRMNIAIQAFKKIIDEDKSLCKLIGGFAALTWHRDAEYYKSGEWRGRWDTEGGGVLINQAVHLIDLISYLAGDIKTVRGHISNNTLQDVIEVEDTADAIFTLAKNVNVCYYATNGYSSNLPMRLELQFENALLRYADDVLYRVDKSGAKIIAKNDDKHPGKDYWGDSHTVVIDNFYNGGKFPTIADAKNSMTALFKFYESAKNNGKEMIIE